MSEESSKSMLGDIANAVTEVVKAVPVYQDAAQPAAQQFGKTIEPAGQELGEAIVTVAKAVNVAMAPLRGLIWGYEKIGDFIQTKVAAKLEDVPPEDIQAPLPNVAVPAIEALRYTGYEETLSGMYANLLAASMDAKTSSMAHPAFVEIIKQMTPDEAKLLKLVSSRRINPIISIDAQTVGTSGSTSVLQFFSTFGEEANCEHKDLTPQYISNLCRLGLIDIPVMSAYTEKSHYTNVKSHIIVVEIEKRISEIPNRTSKIVEQSCSLTPLGAQFVKACISEHGDMR